MSNSIELHGFQPAKEVENGFTPVIVRVEGDYKRWNQVSIHNAEGVAWDGVSEFPYMDLGAKRDANNMELNDQDIANGFIHCTTLSGYIETKDIIQLLKEYAVKVVELIKPDGQVEKLQTNINARFLEILFKRKS